MASMSGTRPCSLRAQHFGQPAGKLMLRPLQPHCARVKPFRAASIRAAVAATPTKITIQGRRLDVSRGTQRARASVDR